MRGVRTDDTLVAVVEHVKTHPSLEADAVLVTGDIVQDESRAGYERFREIMSWFDVPIICIPGNHDDPALMEELLRKPPFQMCGEARFPSWSIIAISTFLVGEDAGGLGKARLTGLDAALREHAGQHVLIAMHHHPLPVGSRWLDGVGLRDSPKFLKLLDRHDNVRAVICGHVHQQSHQVRNRVHYLSSPSTCSQFLPQSEYFALDDLPPGLRWLRLQADGEIETLVHWVDAEHAS